MDEEETEDKGEGEEGDGFEGEGREFDREDSLGSHRSKKAKTIKLIQIRNKSRGVSKGMPLINVVNPLTLGSAHVFVPAGVDIFVGPSSVASS